MKKILSILIGTVAFSMFSFAQNCTVDNSIVITGVYPDTIQGFKDGYVNTDYEQVVQIRIPIDSTLDWNSISIKATVSHGIINSVAGMPSGFMFNCNNSDCKTMGGGNGCGSMYGKPSASDLNKTFKLTIKATLYGVVAGFESVGIQAFPIEYSGYSFKILPEANSVFKLNNRVSSNVYPNPALSSFILEMNAISSENVKISISNTFGAIVKRKNVNLNSGLNTLSIETSDLNSGLYIVSLESSFGVVIHKLMVK